MRVLERIGNAIKRVRLSDEFTRKSTKDAAVVIRRGLGDIKLVKKR